MGYLDSMISVFFPTLSTSNSRLKLETPTRHHILPSSNRHLNQRTTKRCSHQTDRQRTPNLNKRHKHLRTLSQSRQTHHRRHTHTRKSNKRHKSHSLRRRNRNNPNPRQQPPTHILQTQEHTQRLHRLPHTLISHQPMRHPDNRRQRHTKPKEKQRIQRTPHNNKHCIQNPKTNRNPIVSKEQTKPAENLILFKKRGANLTSNFAFKTQLSHKLIQRHSLTLFNLSQSNPQILNKPMIPDNLKRLQQLIHQTSRPRQQLFLFSCQKGHFSSTTSKIYNLHGFLTPALKTQTTNPKLPQPQSQHKAEPTLQSI